MSSVDSPVLASLSRNLTLPRRASGFRVSPPPAPHSPLCSAPLLWVCRAPFRAHLRCPRSLECAERTHSGCSLSRWLCPASASWMPTSLFLSGGSVPLRQRTCKLQCLSPPSPDLSQKNPSCSSPAEVWSFKPGGWLQAPSLTRAHAHLFVCVCVQAPRTYLTGESALQSWDSVWCPSGR